MDKNKTVLKHAEWTAYATVYEVNIRQYTAEGTFAAFEQHLERLRDMGVDILWLMPVNPIGEEGRKGSLGSYYAVKDYMAVNPEFGTMKEFKSLIDRIHDLGMKVIIDWVANHTSHDNRWKEEHPDWYKKDEHGGFVSPYDWTDVLALDYGNKDLWHGMSEAMNFWLKECDIDGFRCDVAMLVPTEFWDFARRELEKTKPVFMLAESEEPAHHQRAFDASYSWEMFKIWQAVAKGEKNAGDIRKQTEKEFSLFPEDAYRLLFTTNHDENSWNGTEYEMFGDATRTFAVLSFMMKGIPLIYSGQEAGLNHRLKFFDKDEIDWSHLYAAEFYTKLTGIKKRNPALYNGPFGSPLFWIESSEKQHILSFYRRREANTVVVLINLSNRHLDVEFDMEELAAEYKNAFTGERLGLKSKEKFHFDPWQYYVFER